MQRHSAIVRITHWIVVLSVLGLLVSGMGILISHPRLYSGETGYVGTPSLIDLPIPFIIGPSVWNRPIHFFFAWILTLTGLAYVGGGFITRHFRNDLVPGESGSPLEEYQGCDVGRSRKPEVVSICCSSFCRLSYCAADGLNIFTISGKAIGYSFLM